jgi:hypothetical protein
MRSNRAKPSVLFVVTSDPQTSPRPAEAVRIAAGIAAGKNLDVAVYLHATATLALSEFPEELVDGGHFNLYLPLVPEFGGSIYVQSGARSLDAIGNSPVPFQCVTDGEIARQAAQSNYLVHF